MAQTVIGFFDEASAAHGAVEKLQSNGISRERIDVSRGSGGTNTNLSGSDSANPVSGSTRDENSVTRVSDDRTVDGAGRNTNVFTDFFNNLFGGLDDNDDADRYSKVAEKSNSIVTVHAQSREEAESIANILDDCGAIDVDERAGQYGGMSAGRSESNSTQGETTIPRTEERGSGRMRSRIIEHSVEEHVRLRDEQNETIHNTGRNTEVDKEQSDAGSKRRTDQIDRSRSDRSDLL